MVYSDIRLSVIASLASLFIVAPWSPSDAVGRAPEMALRPVQGRTLATLSFPAPSIRPIGLTAPQIQSWKYQGDLQPIAVADEPKVPATGVVAPPTPMFAAIDRLQPSLPVLPSLPIAQSPEPLEEFPGAVAVAVPRVAANAKWRRIIEDRPPVSVAVAQCAGASAEPCATSPWSRWHDLVRRVSALKGEERLQAVNEGINALLVYASDDEVYGVGDYWATVQESMVRGRGDCEDIAIAKMWLLNAAGVDLSSMRLVILKDTLRNIDHAVLSVVEDGHQYVLDNTTQKVGRADWMRGYRPIYALSSQQSWIYGTRVPSASPMQVAQISGTSLPQ